MEWKWAAAYPKHDGHRTKRLHQLLPVTIVDLILETRSQLPSVRYVPFSALGRKDMAVLERMLV